MAATPFAAEAALAAETAGAPGAAAEHAGGVFPPFDASTFASQLIWFALTFIALYLILAKVVLPRIGGVLEKRAGTIRGDIKSAAQKSAAAEDARVKMERAVAKARADARTMIDAARADVQAKLNVEQEAAEKRLTDRIDAAEGKIDDARKAALAEIGPIAETLGRDIANKIAPANANAGRTSVGAA